MATLGGCRLTDTIDNFLNNLFPAEQGAEQQAVNAISSSISSLQDTSTSWQQVLEQMEGTLNADAKSLIDNDIQNVLTATEARAGIEVMCSETFFRDGVIDDLETLKAKLLHQTPPVPVPQFCQAVPENITLPNAATFLSYYGYNFDAQHPLTVMLVHKDGSTTQLPAGDVNVPTPYVETITLSGIGLDPTVTNLNILYDAEVKFSVGRRSHAITASGMRF